MNMVLANQGVQTIAIVDDNPDELALRAFQLKRIGLVPYPITGPFGKTQDLVDEIVSVTQGAVCDNRLQPGGYGFYGAEAVAGLYDRAFPAVLITQYLDEDTDFSIRERRRKIPVILRKDDAPPESIAKALDVCIREHHNDVLPTRRACRTLLRVVKIEPESGQDLVDVLVLSWDWKKVVRFPASLLPEACSDKLAVGQRYMARVNTGAEEAADLFFEDFEVAPDPIPEELLG